METKIVWAIISLVLLHASSIISSNIDVCTLAYMDDEVKDININNPLDRYVVLKVANNEECWVNTTYMFMFLSSQFENAENHTGLAKVSNLTMALKFQCSFSNSVHFLPFSSEKVNVTYHLDIVLILSGCSIAIEEVNIFQDFGRIIMLQIFENPLVFKGDSICNYAFDLQSVLIHLSCEKKYYDRHLFWETCKRPFSKTIILSLSICMDIDASVIRIQFPNLHSVVLSKLTITGVLYYPFTVPIPRGQNQITDKAVKETLTLFFDFLRKHYPEYYMFSNMSLILLGCKINQKHIYLNGNCDEIRMKGMGLASIKTSMFQGIRVKTTINLSDNSLALLHQKWFENQCDLKYLYLQNNKLTILPANIFKTLKSVLTIDLSGNRLKSFDIDPFQSLPKIQEIDLNSNHIESLPPNVFKDQINSLKYLYLFSNPLRQIPVWPFHSPHIAMYHLGSANLTGQSIVKLLQRLNNLDIAENEVKAQLALSLKSQGNLPFVILSNNDITTIPYADMTVVLLNRLITLLEHFYIYFLDNPITCNCDTTCIRLVYETTKQGFNSTILYKFIDSVVCKYPSELRGRFMWSITEDEMYCPIKFKDCPRKCHCFQRFKSDRIIVDCRGVPLNEIPLQLPPFTLELWFENSNLSNIEPLQYLQNVTIMNIAHNRIKSISPYALKKLNTAQVINLHSNNLTFLPIQMRSLNLTKLTLSNNPFVCDCTMIWLKSWILNEEDTIPDWTKIQCLETSGKISQMIAVPDSHFICASVGVFSHSTHVILPSIIIGSITFVFLVLAVISYVFRFNIKVLLFIFCDIHPFDNTLGERENFIYDSVIIYVADDIKLVTEVINYLRKREYRIADLYQDSFIGLTWIESIEELIASSKCVILCVHEDSIRQRTLQAAWNIAYNRHLAESLSSLILISNKNAVNKETYDENLRLFSKSNNCIERHDKLLLEKIEYLVSCHSSKEKGINIYADLEENCVDEKKKEVIISYPDALHTYVKDELFPLLGANNINIRALDMMFTIGIDKRNELPEILNAADFVVFVIDEESLEDEVLMYILTEIITRAHLENYNYLLLCTAGQVHIGKMTKELLKYVENYVTISTNDSNFKNRILESITQIRKNTEKNQQPDTEMIPLL